MALLVVGFSASRKGNSVSAEPQQSVADFRRVRPEHRAEAWSSQNSLADRWRNGFPDAARLDSEQDRENFARWVTFLAEAQFNQPAANAQEEINDCAALVRFAYRNALIAHTPAWRQALGLPFDPAFQDVRKFVYPAWPLGRGLFRVQPGPFPSSDPVRDAFAEFADSATLLHYNSFLVSRDLRGARPADLMFYYQAGERQPYHSMIFVGRSYFQPQGSDWIVYHTGDLDGRRGEIREVEAGLLLQHPDPRWRPLESNPKFLGVYRFEILRQ
jgi:uncharacterized protein YfaT (DUF1175 family)